MWIYINYPNPHITIHGDRTCPQIMKQDRSNRRQRKVTDSLLAAFMDDFRNRRIPFAAKSGLNDIWISLELDSTEEAMKVVLEMKDHLGRRYRPLRRAKITVHCGGPDFEQQAAEALSPGYADRYAQGGGNHNQQDRSSKDPGFNGLISRTGSLRNLHQVVDAIERYLEGEIVETELGRIIRMYWRRRD